MDLEIADSVAPDGGTARPSLCVSVTVGCTTVTPGRRT
jgi:hypothetical protein